MSDTESDEGAAESCANLVHAGRVEEARRRAVDPVVLGELADLFKVFADPTRLKILEALSCGELCVCDIGEVVGLSQSAVSHQLAVLRASRLVSARREGKTIYYSPADRHVGLLLELGLDHASERAGGLPDGR